MNILIISVVLLGISTAFLALAFYRLNKNYGLGAACGKYKA